MALIYFHCQVCDNVQLERKHLDDHNVSCIQCGANGTQWTMKDDRRVPQVMKLWFRTDSLDWPDEEGRMPTYKFSCDECHEVFTAFCLNSEKEKEECPKCASKKKTQLFESMPPVTKSMDWQDGRTGEPVDMSHVFGGMLGNKGTHLSSSRQMKAWCEQARDAYLEYTSGTKTTMVPFEDDYGRVHWEKVTREAEGIDLGELHPIETPMGENRPLSPFDSSVPGGKDGETLDQLTSRLKKTAGFPEMQES